MAPKNPLVGPLNKLKDTALGAAKDPRGTADKLVDQAKSTATFGKHLVEGVATTVAERVNARTGRRASDAPRAEPPLHSVPPVPPVPSEPPSKDHGDPVAPTAPGSTSRGAAPTAEPVPATEDRLAARKATPSDVARKTAKKTSAKKAAAKKTSKKATKKAPAKKTAPGDKLPPRAASPKPPPPTPSEIEPNPEAGGPPTG